MARTFLNAWRFSLRTAVPLYLLYPICFVIVTIAVGQGLFDFVRQGFLRWATAVGVAVTVPAGLFLFVRDAIIPPTIRRFAPRALDKACKEIATEIVRQYTEGEQISLTWDGDLVKREAIRFFRRLSGEGRKHGG